MLATSLNEIQKEYMTRSKQSSYALMHIINDILDYSKIEAGKLDLVHEEFELDKIFDNIASLFGYNAYAKELAFNFSIDDTIPQKLIGDPLRLTQVLTNLVGNSIKFTPSGFVSLKVELLKQSEERVYLKFCVQDSGIGISKANQKKLFQSFEQLDSSNTKKYGGTGLGLMISQQLIRLMGGRIAVRSKEHEGSQFYFKLYFEYLPNSQRIRQKLHALKDARCLILSSSPIESEYLLALMEQWGIGSQSVLTLQGALDTVQTQRIDLLLFDWHTIEDDPHLLISVVKTHSLASICMVNTYAKNEVIEQLSRYSINKILEKPYTPSTLYNLLNNDYIDYTKTLNSEEQSIVLADTQKALLVEDNEVNQIVAKALLESYGFSVDLAVDGREALKAAQTHPYDIVFMDLQMPNMDGFEASQKIREFNTSLPIIALSAAVMQKDKELTQAAGMNAHIAKPIIKEEIEKVIQSYFETQTITKTLNPNSHKVEIYGVEYAKLLASLASNESQALSLLKKYYNSYKNIHEALNALANDRDGLRDYIHKLKGVSGNIGARKMYEYCRLIEEANPIEQPTLMQELMQESSLVLQSIKLNIMEKVPQEQEHISEGELRESIEALIVDLQEDHFIQNDRIESFVHSLKDRVEPMMLTQIEKHFASYDYKSLLGILRTIEERLDL